MPAKNRDHYAGSYQRRAAQLRAYAYANPLTKCWRCGKTRAEHGKRWQAGHIIDGDPNSTLAPECETCNTTAGATTRWAKKSTHPSSRHW